MPTKQIRIAVLMDSKGRWTAGSVSDDDDGGRWDDLWDSMSYQNRGDEGNTTGFFVTADIPIPEEFDIVTLAASKVEQEH